MNKHFLLFLLILSGSVQAQYYYKDIIGTQETNDLIKKLSGGKIRSVVLTSYEADGNLTEGFLVQQTVLGNPTQLRTVTKTGDSDPSILVSYFDDKLRLIKTVDSTGGLANISTYQYDEKGNIINIKTWSTDTSGATLVEEEHDWIYDATGRITKMIRKKNKLPANEIVFIYDENGDLVEEKTIQNGASRGSLYYYYNDMHQITDIVRFNERAQRLLPDYMFEYSPSGQVIQKITIPANSTEYFIWRYQYDEKGIKTKEALYDKSKKLLARIEYRYSQ